jgi:hypothetical protein
LNRPNSQLSNQSAQFLLIIWVGPAKTKDNRFLQHGNERFISPVGDSRPEIPSVLCDFMTPTDLKIPHRLTFRKAARERFVTIDARF